MKVKDMRQGSVLEMGSMAVCNDSIPQPILWLKAGRECDFVTKDVVALLPFDDKLFQYHITDNMMGRTYGDLRFGNSFLFRWLNSDGSFSVEEEHGYATRRFSGLPSFLAFWEHDEVDALLEKEYLVGGDTIRSKIRMLSYTDILGANDEKLPLFKKHGVRATLSPDAKTRWRSGSYFSPYWLMDKDSRSDIYSMALEIDAVAHANMADMSIGVRPVCTVDPEAEVFMVGGRCFLAQKDDPLDKYNIADLLGFSVTPA